MNQTIKQTVLAEVIENLLVQNKQENPPRVFSNNFVYTQRRKPRSIPKQMSDNSLNQVRLCDTSLVSMILTSYEKESR